MGRTKTAKPRPASRRVFSVADLHSKTAEALRSLRHGRQPILITEDGRPAAVLISPDDFDRLRQHDRFMQAVRDGLADAEAGRVIDDEALGRQIEEYFDPRELP